MLCLLRVGASGVADEPPGPGPGPRPRPRLVRVRFDSDSTAVRPARFRFGLLHDPVSSRCRALAPAPAFDSRSLRASVPRRARTRGRGPACALPARTVPSVARGSATRAGRSVGACHRSDLELDPPARFARSHRTSPRAARSEPVVGPVVGAGRATSASGPASSRRVRSAIGPGSPVACGRRLGPSLAVSCVRGRVGASMGLRRQLALGRATGLGCGFRCGLGSGIEAMSSWPERGRPRGRRAAARERPGPVVRSAGSRFGWQRCAERRHGPRGASAPHSLPPPPGRLGSCIRRSA